VAFRRYSSDYVSAEDSAKVTKRGLWAGDVPDAFRLPPRRRSARTRSKQDGSRTPRLEGRIERLVRPGLGRLQHQRQPNRKGRRIYRVPGCPATTGPGRRRSSAPRRRPGRRDIGERL
jgi:hypothetical protein